MKLNVAAELKQPGKSGKFQSEFNLEDQEYLGVEIHFLQPLRVSGEFLCDGAGIDIRGIVCAVIRSQCVRCTKVFGQPFSFEYEERFVRNPQPDDECYPFEGDELDLSQMILDNLFLNLPVYSVCREDCKGLCPICGCDLNASQCSCAPADNKENPFAALEMLLYHDKEV